MAGHASLLLLSGLTVFVAAPVAALHRIDTFAGRGYGDGGPAIAAAIIEPADAATDASGNVYLADRGNHLVRRVDAASGIITTVAGNGSPGHDGDGGPATLAQIIDPTGVALDPAGTSLYIAENVGYRVRKVDLATGIITTVAGSGVKTHTIDREGGDPRDDVGDGRRATLATLSSPSGVAVNAAGDLFIADPGKFTPSTAPRDSPRIRRVDHATGIITTFAGTGVEGFSDNRPAAQAMLANAIGLQFDAAGNLYIGELGNHRVRKISATPPHTITSIAGKNTFYEGPAAFFGDGGPALQAGLARPVRIALHPQGCGGPAPAPACEVYIGDSLHSCIRRVDTNGIITTVVNGPTPVSGDSGDGGPALAARARTPGALPGPAGTILVVDDGSNRIRLYDPATGIIRAFAGTGEGGFGGDGRPAVQALLNRPTGLARDAAGAVYVTDHNNHRVRRIGADANRIIVTVAGTGESGAGGNGGLATDAALAVPTGVTVLGTGDVLVIDAGTETVRRIDVTGFIFPFAGRANTGGFGGDGGPATSATLSTPLRSVQTPAGDVLIADFNNGRIRRVDATGTITTLAGGLANPAGVAVGADGGVYVSEFGAQRISVIDAGGVVHPLAGTGVRTGSLDGEGGSPADDRGDGGAAHDATFSDPTGLAVEADGSLLVADQGNNLVRRIAAGPGGVPTGASVVTTLVGDGRPTFGGDGGNALAASLNRPTEVLPLDDGRLLVADRGNQRVRMVTEVASLCEASCDDSDPCTTDGCTETAGCTHEPASDGDGDGVCDAVDVCPTVPNVTQDPSACPDEPPGAACAVGHPSCIPGRGPQAGECLVETVVRGANGTPLVGCTDGDDACDVDPAPGRCGFIVSWCFNNADPRLACTAAGLRRVAFRAGMTPRAAGRGLVADALAAVGGVGDGARRGGKLLFASPLMAPNRCTPSVTVPVALRRRGTRPGRATITVTGTTTGQAPDVDTVRLVCTPPG